MQILSILHRLDDPSACEQLAEWFEAQAALCRMQAAQMAANARRAATLRSLPERALAGDPGLASATIDFYRDIAARRQEATSRAARRLAREREIARLIRRGLSNAEVARKLGVSPSTVARTWRRISDHTFLKKNSLHD
ncbi:LuxR C-terminal-related transcriptional regulator [Oceanibaculum indicum]|uniref:LuxR C-terminal-related transcriptional regulator n=1 Tax=Oceanibaculum indicum TaxID=526216 RepID=UPI001C7D3083|nr:helix-turn-helix domain-containing protein [Oceanibaculum indicum]